MSYIIKTTSILMRKKLEIRKTGKFFKKKKKEVKKLLATSKENYIKGKLDELEGNPRKFCHEINNISGLGKNKNGRVRKNNRLK